jgi:hypothetical protein
MIRNRIKHRISGTGFSIGVPAVREFEKRLFDVCALCAERDGAPQNDRKHSWN